MRSCLLGALLLAGCATSGDEPTDETPTDDGETDSDSPADTDVVDDDTAAGDSDTGETEPDDTLEWPSSPEAYTYGDVVYLSSFDIPPAAGPQRCCRDWGAASKNPGIDNAIATLKSLTSAFLDFEAELDASIENGIFVALLDLRDLPSGDGAFPMSFLLADFAPGSWYGPASLGDGEFLVDPQSFLPGTGEPQVYFPEVQRTGDDVSGSGGDLAIALAFAGVSLYVPVQDVSLDARLFEGDDGRVALTDGSLSGYIRTDDFFGAYNDAVDQICGCAGLTGPLFTKSRGTWTGTCLANDDVAELCPLSDEYACAFLLGSDLAQSGVCGLVESFLPLVPDIDTNGTPNSYEGISVGLRFETAPAEVVGLLP